MYAVISSGGKQFRVAKGDVVQVEKLSAPIGSNVDLKEVLLIDQGSTLTVGTPVIKNALVEAKVIDQTYAPKIIVFKKHRRKNYRRKNGHRQLLTRLKVTAINA